MKKYLAPFLIACVTSNLFAGGTPGGPWANGAYYPGYLNGKYMGVVTGNNIAGVLGFAIVDGAPPFRTQQTESSAGGAISSAPLVNSSIVPDATQNYFAIFVEGRTYTGLTTAGIDISSKTVAGALTGTDPSGITSAGAAAGGGGGGAGGGLAFDATDALSIINRGLSGGFTANIKCDKAVFTFKGDGQLSTPANRQSFTVTAVPLEAPGFPLNVPVGTITNEYVTGVYETESTPFQVKGIRTSFNAFSLQGSLDQNASTAGTQGGAAN